MVEIEKAPDQASVMMLKDYTDFKKGEILPVVGSTGKTYKVKNKAGVPMFIPKTYVSIHESSQVAQAIADVKTARAAADTKAAPVVNADMSDEERRMLKALSSSGTVDGLKSNPDADELENQFVPPKTDEEKAREALQPPPVQLLQEGEFWLTDLTDGRLPDSGVNHIIKANLMGDWEEHQQKDVPDVDLYYFWDANALESLWMAYDNDHRLLFNGMPGTGKTSAIHQFAAFVQHPYMRFNGKDGIEQSSFLGMPWAEPGGMVWKDGLMVQACKEGYIICIDEVFKIPPGIIMALQGLFEKGGKLMLDDKPGTLHDKQIAPHPKFRMMLTDNVRGVGDNFEKFSATQLQDTSTIDRFGITYELDYLPEDEEVSMVARRYPDVPKGTIREAVKFAGLVRNAYKSGDLALTMSPRGIMTTMDMHQDYNIPIRKSLDYAFVNKVADEAEIQSVQLMIDTAFGRK